MKKKQMLFISFFVMVIMFFIPLTAKADWVLKDDGNYYYYNAKGKLLKKQWIGDYYVDSKGAMVRNSWIKKRFVGEDGKVIPNFRGGWVKINGKWYYYTKAGVKRAGWIKKSGKKYYLNKNGVRLTKWRNIKNNRYYFHKKSGYMLTGWQEISQKWYYFDINTGIMQKGWTSIDNKKYYFDDKGVMLSGLQNLQGNTYYFNSKGKMLTGWRTVNSKKYYFMKKTGIMVKGLKVIGGATYYFGNNGVLQKNKTININGTIYYIDGNGKCTVYVPASNIGVNEQMLFFTRFESGSAGYAQTGGDNGNACGLYQFDYRYSLLPLVKYCYVADPVLFAEFKTYANYPLTSKYKAKLKGNTKFYTAWKTIYNRSPLGFASYQDSFAKQEYYDVTADYLYINYGIILSGRSDVVKGAVFSYSIQHGAQTAAIAINAAKITNSISDKNFIKKLYDYRWSSKSGWAKNAVYKQRYLDEKALALSLL